MLVNGAYPLTVRYVRSFARRRFTLICARHDNSGKIQPGFIGPSQFQRQWIGLSLTGDQANVESLPSQPHPGAPGFMQAIDIEVGFVRRKVDVAEVYLADDMAKNFTKAFNGIAMSTEQQIAFEYHGQPLKGTIKAVVLLEVPGNPASIILNTGIISPGTDVTFMKAPDSSIKIKSSSKKSVMIQLSEGGLVYLFSFFVDLLPMQSLLRISSSRTWESADWIVNSVIFSDVHSRLVYSLLLLLINLEFNT